MTKLVYLGLEIDHEVINSEEEREENKQTNTSEPIVLSRMNKNKSSLGYIAVKPQKIQRKEDLEIQQRKWLLAKDQQLH